MSEPTNQAQAVPLDLESVRAYLACKGTPKHGHGCGCRNGVELLRETFAAVERARSAAAKVHDLKAIPDRIGGWTDQEAFKAYNRRYTEAYYAALTALGDLIGKDNAEAMFGVPA